MYARNDGTPACASRLTDESHASWLMYILVNTPQSSELSCGMYSVCLQLNAMLAALHVVIQIQATQAECISRAWLCLAHGALVIVQEAPDSHSSSTTQWLQSSMVMPSMFGIYQLLTQPLQDIVHNVCISILLNKQPP